MCAVALLPMLLWPSLAASDCCCTDLLAPGQVVPEHSLQPQAAACSPDSPQPLAGTLETSGGCPKCVTSPRFEADSCQTSAATWNFHCACQAHLLANYISLRAETAAAEVRPILVSSFFPTQSPAIDVSAALGVCSYVPVRLLSPTATERRAILCCWLI